jgi:DNA-directed RNA polymerase subunit RPC12/RpoP
MTFPFTCSSCGHVNHFGWSQAGQKIKCAGCARSMTVPVPMETVGESVPPPRPFRFRCPSCGRKFSTKPELAGKKIRCSGCGAGVRVPQGDENDNAQPSGAAIETYAGSSEATAPLRPGLTPTEVPTAGRDQERVASPLLDELGWIDTAKRPKRVESVLPSRSELMEQVRQQELEAEEVETQAKAMKAKKKKKGKKKGSSYFDPKETLTLVAGVGAVVGVLAFLAWGYPDFRFPLGGLLCVVGFIVYMLGSISLRQLVAEDGFVQALMFRFCPPYQLWFIVTRWADAKDFFAFFLAGAIIMSIGGFVIKTSPTGVKAEASERAYQKLQKSKKVEAPPPASNVFTPDDD